MGPRCSPCRSPPVTLRPRRNGRRRAGSSRWTARSPVRRTSASYPVSQARRRQPHALQPMSAHLTNGRRCVAAGTAISHARPPGELPTTLPAERLDVVTKVITALLKLSGRRRSLSLPGTGARPAAPRGTAMVAFRPAPARSRPVVLTRRTAGPSMPQRCPVRPAALPWQAQYQNATAGTRATARRGTAATPTGEPGLTTAWSLPKGRIAAEEPGAVALIGLARDAEGDVQEHQGRSGPRPVVVNGQRCLLRHAHANSWSQ